MRDCARDGVGEDSGNQGDTDGYGVALRACVTNIWFDLVAGVVVLAALTMLGGWWMALKTGGAEQARVKRVARIAWWIAAALTVAVAVVSFYARPETAASIANDPRHTIAAMIAMSGLIGVKLWDRKETELLTFFASVSFVAGILLGA